MHEAVWSSCDEPTSTLADLRPNAEELKNRRRGAVEKSIEDVG